MDLQLKVSCVVNVVKGGEKHFGVEQGRQFVEKVENHRPSAP